MFLSEGIRGYDLHAKTVCLTFDDGPGETRSAGDPGPRTLELAQFLHDRNITATFFMIGEFVEQHRGIVDEVSKLGHLIGNHTYDHTNLGGQSRAFVVKQITQTDQLLRDVPTFRRYFRPPQGELSESLVTELNSTEETKSYVGPILWAIPTRENDRKTADWRYWEGRKSAKACAEAYIADIEAAGHGIILMHDGLHEKPKRSGMYPLEMATLVVNWLQKNGYEFASLDSVVRAQRSP